MFCQCSRGTITTQPCTQLPRPQRSNLQHSPGTLTQTPSPRAGGSGCVHLQPPAPMRDREGHETPHAEEPSPLPQPRLDIQNTQQHTPGYTQSDQSLQCRQPCRAPGVQEPYVGSSLPAPPPAVGTARTINAPRSVPLMSREDDQVSQRLAGPPRRSLQHARGGQQSALALPTHPPDDSDEQGDSLSLPFPDFCSRDIPPPHPASVSTKPNLTLPGGAHPPATCTLDTRAETGRYYEENHLHASVTSPIGSALAFGIGINSHRHSANRMSQRRLRGVAHSSNTFRGALEFATRSKSRPSDRTAHGGGWRSIVHSVRRPCTGPTTRQPRTTAPEYQVQAHSA